ncbi:MAG: DUF4332 domain-containing protein [Mariniblastus sp.]|nr:DUF4332 domain-containing protein [Mariniblastus sp.]
MSNSKFYDLICAHECRNTHHKLVMNSLRHLQCPLADQWRSIYERYFEYFLMGSKDPDTKFKDFRNHVLHVSDNYWGGPVKQADKWYAITVAHLKSENWKSAVYSSGVLSHYFMDPLMPLHTGQTEEEGVIHRACEWSVNKSFDQLISILEQGEGYPDVKLPTGTAWLKDSIHQGATIAHSHYDSFIDHYNPVLGSKDPPSGLDDHLRKITSRLLGQASVGFARVLERAIAAANANPTLMGTGWLSGFYRVTRPVSWVYRGYRQITGQRQVSRIASEFRRQGKVIQCLPRDEKLIRAQHADEILGVDLEALDAQPLKPVGSKFVMENPGADQSPSRGRQAQSNQTGQSKTPSTTYRLELSQLVEAAPSIGKKTAARLAAVGVTTVADLLDADSHSIAHRLDVRHIDGATVQQWQIQTALACRIPMIYGHDAQILEGCGFESPEEIASSEPAMILSLVHEFAKSKDAKFILRGGKAPDLAEVTNWVEWSRNSRPLKAA